MAHAVLVLDRALEDVGEDLHVAMGMGGEAAARRHPVLVDHPELPEAHVVGVVIVAERERVAGVQPPEVETTPLARLPDDDHLASKRGYS